MALRYLWLISPIVFLAVGFLLGRDLINLPGNLSALNVKDMLSTTLVIDYGNDKVTTYGNVELPYPATVYDLLRTVISQNGLSLTIDEAHPLLITGIDGVVNLFSDDDVIAEWQYAVNAEPGSVRADDYQLFDGANVRWSYIAVE